MNLQTVLLFQCCFLLGSSIFSLDVDHRSKSAEPFWCPSKCTCAFAARIADCSGRGLQRVPDLHKATVRLYLHGNRITSLLPGSFQSLRQLTYLILASNAIHAISEDAFNGLQSLKYLILDGNNITTLPQGVFRGLKHLETVSLANNQLQVLPAALFTQCSQLTMISLQGNGLQTITPRAFHGPPHLHTLNLQNNLLDDRVFEELTPCKKLVTLRLHSNQISRLPSSMTHMQYMKTLHLQFNNISRLPQHFLNECSSLETLLLNHNLIDSLPSSLFVNCSHLTRLDLSRNAIAELDSHVFNGLQAVKTIHLEHNLLPAIRSRTFSDLPRLEAVYANNNMLDALEDLAFHHLPRMKLLFLVGNKITSLRSSAFSNLTALQVLQIDTLPCSCQLLPLAQWVKQARVWGVKCRRKHSPLSIDISLLVRECPDTMADQLVAGEHSEFPPADSQVALLSSEESGRVTKNQSHCDCHGNNTGKTPQQTLSCSSAFGESVKQAHPARPVGHVSSTRSVAAALEAEDMKAKLSHLQMRMKRMEIALEARELCQRWVCFHEGVRFEPGDQWRGTAGVCSCTQNGVVECH